MPTWAAALLKFILDYLIGKISDWVGKVVARFKRRKEIEKEAEESAKPMDKAKTEKEIDDAAKDLLGGL